MSHPFEGYLNLDLKSHETAMTYDSNYYLPNGTMPADIKAAEFLYGGNPNANTENNTYSWSAYENLNYRNAIIDKGGTDTIDLSNHNNGVFINLNSDSWSSLSYNGNSNDFQNESEWAYQSGQIYISPQSTIENVTGSNFSDLIYGNNANNFIKTEGGDDEIYHISQQDIIDGGSGDDIVYLQNKSLTEILDVYQANDNYIIEFSDYDLTIKDVENIRDQNLQTRSLQSLIDEFSLDNDPPVINNISIYESPSGFVDVSANDTIRFEYDVSDESGFNSIQLFFFRDGVQSISISDVGTDFGSNDGVIIYQITVDLEPGLYELQTVFSGDNSDAYNYIWLEESKGTLPFDISFNVKSLNQSPQDLVFEEFSIEENLSGAEIAVISAYDEAPVISQVMAWSYLFVTILKDFS